MIVIDASMAAAMVLADEADPPIPLQERIYAGPVIAPAHWIAEIGNTLLFAERRRRITREERLVAIERVWTLNAVVVDADAEVIWGDGLDLADTHRLTLYDSLYLELAMRRGAALASNDRDLVDAARIHGIEVFTCLP